MAQAEPSWVGFGMPKEAIKFGDAGKVIPLATIPITILNGI